MQVRGSPRQESESEKEDNALSTRDDQPNGEKEGNGDEDDDLVAARPRKLISRRERSSTPEAMPQAQEGPSSPGLFVSPSKPQSPSGQDAPSDDDDLPSPTALTKNPRFMALVAKKRKERLAREAEEARKRAERQKAAGIDEVEEEDYEDNITDDEGGRKLTQEVGATRPARKASKKALEEMHRETQRLSRSLQLAHEAKVKKKITKAALFERFNFKPEGSETPAVAEPPVPATSSRAPTPGSAPQSDAEMKDVETPPSSPPTVGKDGKAEEVRQVATEVDIREEDDDRLLDEDLPSLEEIAEASRKRLDKGKGKAAAADLSPPKPAKRNIRVKLPTSLQANTASVSFCLDSDSENDLQIHHTSKSKSKIDAIFARVPLNQAKQPRSLQLLRKLAQLDDPDKKGAPPVPARCRTDAQTQQAQQATVMTTGELHASLLQRARAQAKVERDRHLEMLRAKGVHVQTAEEREREMQEVEDIVARARKEAEELMEREREEARREKRAKKKMEGGEEDPLALDDSEDEEDYLDETGDEEEMELSGSEEEEEEGEEEEEEGEEGEERVIDDVAEEAEDGEEHAEEDSDEELPSSKQVRRRARKQVTILSDDEEDVEPLVKATPRAKTSFPKSPSVRNAESPSVPTSVLRSATKTFIPGLPVAGPAGLGLTQIFAGTMDDSQMGSAGPVSPSQPRPTFDVTAFPDSNFSQTAQEAAEDMILDSQPTGGRETQTAETQGIQIRFSQSQVHGFDTFLEENHNATQMSELIEPSQDSGFQNFSPLRQRFVEVPASTIDTVKIGQSQADAEEQNESPLVRRTGKLRRKADVVPASPTRRPVSDDQDEGDDEAMEDFEMDEFGFGTVSNNAFAAMKEAALKEKKRKEAFDKKKSKAREMIEEQAEESEDEYAGLGGADGEDSDDDDDHSVQEIIDDETKNDEGDERKLAAFYA